MAKHRISENTIEVMSQSRKGEVEPGVGGEGEERVLDAAPQVEPMQERILHRLDSLLEVQQPP